ncbi:MAG: hypothetical protein A2798_03115 [Candidatus Levybacteria bacterium RIFCSPHIGHO2_01_FULL_37_17]|nr:MAG: hypothetical protein A2798_03115 [Candidatus Levybacteria bacterium RIFCSPHIGHO2_01_FULL_37_17]OGH36845.1 MAG: hypothetical protein A2959_01105 [Candidatus Levybacteria bacterium RIFCSPLOWO2_01_FULL_38_23]
MKKLLVLLVALIVLLATWFVLSTFTQGLLGDQSAPKASTETVKIVKEESVVVDVVKNVGPSVVTVVEIASLSSRNTINFGPFGFNIEPQQQQPQPRNIGSGFVVDSLGLIVTNKHVVSDTNSKYQIVTSNNKTYNVDKISRDPLNDIALLKVNLADNPENKLTPVIVGDSSTLQVGQFVIAIGTALGEFKNTVTTGVISGLGRGIIAGSDFQGFVEKLDNVIQTDAAINPGNSGGPLVASNGQVVGINTAVSQSAQNIGFALPINVLKDALKNFNQFGQFNRPYLGISYTMLNSEEAKLNKLAQGAYIQNVISKSPAEKAGIKAGDVITKFDGKDVKVGVNELAALIALKKVGDNVNLTVLRSGQTISISATLGSAPVE